jgi:vesicle coat complex subunit
MEKLEIMIKLASVKNIEKVLLEFKEYASEVDVEFVRKAVLAIGRCAIKIAQAAERCIQVLLELIQTKVNYVVQESDHTRPHTRALTNASRWCCSCCCLCVRVSSLLCAAVVLSTSGPSS